MRAVYLCLSQAYHHFDTPKEETRAFDGLIHSVAQTAERVQ